MSLLERPVPERLEYLQELLSCTGKVYRWSYDREGNLLDTNCPDKVLNTVFIYAGSIDALLAHAQESRLPIMLSNDYGLNWSAALEFDGDVLQRFHVFGPVTTMELSHDSIVKIAQAERTPVRWRPKFIRILERIPTVSTIDFLRHTLMLHYCITGEQLTNADIVFETPVAQSPAREEYVKKDRLSTYQAEQALLKMVREGDLNYKGILQNAARFSQGVRTAQLGNLDQIRVSQIVFISLCTRAAIEGGVSPEMAYTRGDAYIQDIMNCRTIADAAHIGHTMYDDFVRMVHDLKADSSLSPQIRSCCEYIELHAEEPVTLKELSHRIGYTDYYLSRKFKAETGTGINDYIKQVKIRHAQTLLTATDLSIQEICDRLHFGSRSFFARTFRDITGTPPAAYREMTHKM